MSFNKTAPTRLVRADAYNTTEHFKKEVMPRGKSTKCKKPSKPYPEFPLLPHATKLTFRYEVDFGIVIKSYGKTGEERSRRYPPASIISIKKKRGCGAPNPQMVSTSHCERLKLSLRMGIRRLTRPTYAHIEKWENHEAMLALYFAWYNFRRPHSSLENRSPAWEHGLTDRKWTIDELLAKAVEKCVMSDQPLNRWSPFSVVLAVFFVLVLYVLSVGPAVGVHDNLKHSGTMSETISQVLAVFYFPLEWLAQNVEPVGDFFDWYFDIWKP